METNEIKIKTPVTPDAGEYRKGYRQSVSMT